jgi:uncharacterized protein DUF3800
VYLLYVDESDTSSDDAGRLVYCVCGLRCIDISYGATVERLAKLIRKWQPTLPANFEIKGSDVFHGEGSWPGRSVSDRAAFARALTQVLHESNIKLFVGMKDSEDFTEDYKVLLGKVISCAAKVVAKSGTKTSKQMMLVFDQRPDFNPRYSEALRDARDEVITQHKASCRFIDFGYEADSRHAPLVQAADFVAYHLRKREIIEREDTLLTRRANDLLIELLDEIAEKLEKKVVRVG